jgi:Cys-rich repeat protein
LIPITTSITREAGRSSYNRHMRLRSGRRHLPLLLVPLLLLTLAGCGGGDGGCRCTGAVTGGQLDLACGKSSCLGGHGYKCLAAQSYAGDDSICSAGQGDCPAYLACIALSQPMAFPVALQTYGPSAACWTTTARTAGLCLQACAASLKQLHDAGECVCTADTQCPSGKYCDVASQHCGDCWNDAQCHVISAPHCLLPANTTGVAGRCVQCRTNSDCGTGFVCQPDYTCNDLL